MKLKLSDGLKILIPVVILVSIGVSVYLSNDDGGVTGWQILMNQTGNEWFWMIGGTLLAASVVYAYLRYYRKTQDSRGLLVFAVAFVTFLSIAFGKACTDKANGGVTSGNGRPGGAPPADTTRIPAEDLIPKK